MFILFGHSTPAPLRYSLKGHRVVEAFERAWDRLVKLLDAAEAEGFRVFMTADKSFGINKISLPERSPTFLAMHSGLYCAAMLTGSSQPWTARYRAATLKCKFHLGSPGSAPARAPLRLCLEPTIPAILHCCDLNPSCPYTAV